MVDDHRQTGVVEFIGDQPPELAGLAQQFPTEVQLVESKGFGAIDPSLQALLVLTPAVTMAITKIVVAHIQAKQPVKIKANGVEIEGVDADEAVRLLKSLSTASPSQESS